MQSCGTSHHLYPLSSFLESFIEGSGTECRRGPFEKSYRVCARSLSLSVSLTFTHFADHTSGVISITKLITYMDTKAQNKMCECMSNIND